MGEESRKGYHRDRFFDDDDGKNISLSAMARKHPEWMVSRLCVVWDKLSASKEREAVLEAKLAAIKHEWWEFCNERKGELSEKADNHYMMIDSLFLDTRPALAVVKGTIIDGYLQVIDPVRRSSKKVFESVTVVVLGEGE